MDYLEILETYRDEIIKTLADLVAFPSVLAPAVKTADGEVLPFGRNVHDAYEYMMCAGDRLGFKTFNADNYGGHIEFSSEDEKAETLAVVGHLDVVPAGDGWTSDPFTLEERDGVLVGRGVVDDKGPLVAALYAMKALKESGFEPKKNIRMILGLDEETCKGGMTYYLDKAGQPDMGFTPDSDFPLVNGEMGILVFDLAQKLTKQISKEGLRLTKMEAGKAFNAVPGSARAVVAGDEKYYELIKDRLAQFVVETGYTIKAKKQGSSLVIEATGVATHGAHPDRGLNAISILMEFLGRLQFNNEEINDFIDFYNDHIGFDMHGERMGCAFSDEPSGKLILNPAIVRITEDIATLTVNIRYPVTCTSEAVYEGIENTIGKNNIGVVKDIDFRPIYQAADSPFVGTLMDAYRSETGDMDAQPFSIAGGTYAKDVNNTLAFGGLFPGEEDTMHQTDEHKTVDNLMKMARIYARAIYSICCE